MTETNINAVDLNLLRVFDALLEEGSVTRAGARLGLSQSAVSHSLGRLRTLLDDELFVRTASGIRPTTRATEMGPDVHAALRQIQAALSVKAFNPAETERRFTVMAGAYTNAVLTPVLVERLAAEAPKAELVIAWGDPDVMEQLDAQRVDFVVGPSEQSPDRVLVSPMLREALVWVVRAGHPLTKGKITIERLAETPHVAIRRRRTDPDERPFTVVMRGSWEDYGAFENELRTRGLKRRIGVTVPDTYSALAIVRRSEMAALIPRRVATAAAQTGFVELLKPPYPPSEVELSLLCLRERMSEPAQRWMHGLILDVASKV